jgi:hypothetical protein
MNEERSRKSGNRQQRLSLNRLEFIAKEQIPPNVSNMVSLPRLSILLRHVVKQSFACLSFASVPGSVWSDNSSPPQPRTITIIVALG